MSLHHFTAFPNLALERNLRVFRRGLRKAIVLVYKMPINTHKKRENYLQNFTVFYLQVKIKIILVFLFFSLIIMETSNQKQMSWLSLKSIMTLCRKSVDIKTKVVCVFT